MRRSSCACSGRNDGDAASARRRRRRRAREEARGSRRAVGGLPSRKSGADLEVLLKFEKGEAFIGLKPTRSEAKRSEAKQD